MINQFPFSLSSHPTQKNYPLTENQRGIYLAWEMSHDTTQYNVPNVLKFTDKTAEGLEMAVRTAFAAHGYLKTRFVQIAEDVMQQPSAEETEILVQKLDKEPDAAFFQSRVRPFDLLNERLYRVEIYSAPNAVYMFIDIHHIIYDGLSNTVLMNDILAAYDGKSVKAEKVTAYDFALYEKEIFASEAFAKAEARFDSLVGDAAAVNYPVAAKPDGKSTGTVTAFVAADIVDSFCEKNSVTVDSFMQAAFAETLHRITREENPLYVTISNGRLDGASLERSIGMFVKTLPVVLQTNATPFGKGGQGGFGPANHANHANGSEGAQTHGEQKVSDYVRSIHKQLQESYASDFYPYTRIVERHGLRAGIMFKYQGGLFEGGVLEHESAETVSLSLDTVKFPVDVTAYPDNGRLVIHIEYDGMKYGRYDMQMLADVFANVAERMAAAGKLKDIELLSAEQKEDVYRVSRGETIEFDRSQTYLDLFKKRVAAHPDKTAVTDITSSITYKELDEQSDALAAYLIESGVKPNDFVVMLIDRVKEFIIGILGIHKAGAGYVPVALDYPEDRRTYMIKDSESKVILTEDSIRDIVTKNAGKKPEYRITPDCHAYMIYTSGSTGKPKGTRLHQRGLLNYTYSFMHMMGIREDDRISFHRAFSFDAHIEDVYPTLSIGASLFIMPERIRRDPEAIYNFLMKYDITCGYYTTSIAKLLVSEYELKQRFIACSGEALNDVTCDKVPIINMYGPTECTDLISIYKLEKGKHYDSAPIGRPMANGYAFVVDIYDKLLPAGMIGELCYAGPQVSYGYWHLDAKTREVFGDCPFVDGIRMYHTGDLARYSESGDLEFFGRKDNQIKLRGFRIELGEIEVQASMFPGIGLVSAQIRNEQIVLYYTSAKNQEIDKKQLKEHLSKSLADYMVPTAFMHMEQMPFTPSGKIDRKALPEPEFEVAEIVAPASEAEQKLFEIASEMLKTDKFGVTTSLISMGLSSLMSMRFAAAVQKRMGKKISVADIMKLQTIRLIASNLGSEDITLAIKAYQKQEFYPLTENQRGLYIDWEMHRDTTQYNVPNVLKFTDKTAEDLEMAVRTAFAAHGYLKTRFVQIAEDVMQKPSEEETEILVQKLDKEPDVAFFQSRVRPFDLLSERLYRVEIYSAPKAVYLFMDIHHIIYDGSSSSVLMNDIMSAYAGKSIEAEKITAYDFALYEKEVSASERYTRAEKYFDSLVCDASVVNYPHSASPDGCNGLVTVSVSADMIDGFSKDKSVTASSFIHAAFAEIMHRITREENPLFVTIDTGRLDSIDLQRSMGMFVKTLPVVLQTGSSGNPESALTHAEQSVYDYVKSIHAQLQESYSNDCYPYTKIVERHGIRANCLIAYQVGVVGEADMSGSESAQISLKLDTVKFPIIMFVSRDKDSYSFTFEYDGSKYIRSDIEQLGRILTNTLVSMTRSEKVRDIRLVSEDEEKQVIELSRGSVLEYDMNETWVDMFRKQCTLHPDREAVTDVSGSITYSELDRMSDVLAADLINSGVMPEDFVAVRMPRSKEFEIAVLAIHKVGAAYVPIDADYPKDRIDYIMKDSGARLEITGLAYENGRLVLNGRQLEPGKNVKPVNKARPELLAYMIYTSGSTGKPKGVMMPHRGMTNFIHSVCKECNLNENSRISCHSNFAFDVSVESLYPALTVGGCVFIFPEEARKDIGALRKLISDYRITGGGYSTAVGQLIAADEKLDVEYINLAGEKMTTVPNITGTVINGYGPTETCYCTFYKLDKNREYSNIPIGRPLPNLIGYVVDQYGQLMPAGLTGELCIAGPQVARGYWNRPDLTSERFETLRSVGTQVYHTGDLVRYNEENQLEYLGRIDFQVKLRGFRIELGEVDNVASQFSGMKQVIAQVRKLGTADSLVLYYSADRQIDKDELKSFMAKSLAEYMVPAVFMQLDDMPMTPNGKIDRKRLPEPENTANSLKMVKPANKDEAKALEYAKMILPGIEFGVTDNLMELGMNSLASMKYAILLKTISRKIKVSDIARFKTIRALLENKLRICWWHKGYDPSKPNLVFMMGLIPVAALLRKFDNWSELFNILIFEPIPSHYDRLFKNDDIEEVILLYTTIIHRMIPDRKVFAFMGYSYGGDMALRMAQKYREINNEYCQYVILGDTSFDATESITQLANMFIIDGKIVGEGKFIQAAMGVAMDQNNPDGSGSELTRDGMIADEIVILYARVIISLNSKKEKYSYDGKVVYFNAVRNILTEAPDKADEYIRAKIEPLRKYLKNLEIIDFNEYDHFGLFNDDALIPFYRKFFEERLAMVRKS